MAVTRDERAQFKHEIHLAEQKADEMNKEVWERGKEFFKGNHRPDSWSGEPNDFISVNLIFANVMSQLPALSFKAPNFDVDPKAVVGANQATMKQLEQGAETNKALLNHYREKHHFREEFQRGVLDSFFAFGCWKVYHKVKKIPNPNAGEPKVRDGEVVTDGDGEIVTEDDTVPLRTEFKARRVQPMNFLVDPTIGNNTSSAKWIAEKVPMRTSRAREKFNTSRIEPVARYDEDITGRSMDTLSNIVGIGDTEESKQIDFSIAYEVWDLNNMRKFYMFQESDRIYKEKPIPRDYRDFDTPVPYVLLKINEIPDEFYPLPDVVPQIPLNLEYDLARTRMNQYRKQFVLKYLIQEGKIGQDQIDSLESDRVGDTVKVEGNLNNPPVREMKPPNVPSTILETMNVSVIDQRRVSGVTPSAMGSPGQNIKATQAMQAENHLQNKMEWKRMKVQIAGEKIGRRLMSLIQHRMESGGVVEIAGPAGAEWREYSPTDLEGDFKVSVDFGSTGPSDDAAERNQYMNVLEVLSQFPQLLQWFDHRALAKELTDHFPLAKHALLDEPDMMAFEGGGGVRRGGGQPGQAGPRRGQVQGGPGPSGQASPRDIIQQATGNGSNGQAQARQFAGNAQGGSS